MPAKNAQMFTRINGPEPKHFRPRRFSKYWVEVLGRLRADDPLNGVEEVEEEDEKEETLLGESLFT